jgi:Bacteriophage head to tail connecting protein
MADGSKPSTAGQVERARARAKKAWADKLPYERQLQQIYRYFMPYRDGASVGMSTDRSPSTGTLNQQSTGNNRTDYIFDNTAPAGALRFAGRLQTDLCPPFEDFATLVAGPVAEANPDKSQGEKWTAEVQSVARAVNAARGQGSFNVAFHEFALDLFAGTACMLRRKGTKKMPLAYYTAPIGEIALIPGPFNEIWGVDWRRKFKHSELEVLWPEGVFGNNLGKAMADKPEETVEIHQETMFDPKTEEWVLRVFTDKCLEKEGTDDLIHTERFRVSPWIVARFFVVPGEVYGRGPAHLALPSAKTLNKMRELELLAAAFAVMGIWTVRNDGVFNPDTAAFTPGARWVVASNGGAFGESVKRLDTPKDFDIAHFVMQDEREQLKQAMLDNGLPPQSGAVKSATEIAETVKRVGQDYAGVFGRMVMEIVVPLFEGDIDQLQGLDMLPIKNVTIDQLMTRIRVVAPIAASQQADKFQRAVNWLQALTMLLGQQAAMAFANIEELGGEMGRWLGVEERFIRSNDKVKQLMQMAGQMQAQQAKAQQQAQGQQPDAEEAGEPPAAAAIGVAA